MWARVTSCPCLWSQELNPFDHVDLCKVYQLSLFDRHTISGFKKARKTFFLGNRDRSQIFEADLGRTVRESGTGTNPRTEDIRLTTAASLV